jgi:ketosteroid isomerase-like protein
MKLLATLSALVFGMTIVSWAAEPSAAVKEGVLNAEEKWKAAVLKGDANALETLLSADLSYTHSSGKTQTKEQFIQDATGGGTVYKSIEFQDTKVRQYGRVAVITHSAVITTVQTGTTHLYLTEVWAQEGGRWQMASRQATKIP